MYSSTVAGSLHQRLVVFASIVLPGYCTSVFANHQRLKAFPLLTLGLVLTATCYIPSQSSPPKSLNDRVCSLTNKPRTVFLARASQRLVLRF
ncbi:hypothetical protein V8E52_000707 [Russula decolorans]